MNLSQDERNIIYKEELEKMKKEKLNKLSEEERKKIFEEESKIKTVVVSSSMINYSFYKRNRKVILIVEFISIAIVAWFFSIIVSILLGGIFGIIENFVNKDTVSFECPYCGNKRTLFITNDSKVNNNDFLNNYNIYVREDVDSELKCTRCNRKYKFKYNYLEKKCN